MATINGKACVANGRNLLTGTSSDLQTKQLTNWWSTGPQATNGNFKIKVFKGQTYTYRAWLDNTNGPGNTFVDIRFLPTTEGAKDIDIAHGVPIKKGETGYSTSVFTIPEDGFLKLTPFSYATRVTALAGWKEEKLEKGSVATPYLPAPVDKVFSNGKQVYGRNMIPDSGFESGNTPANYGWGDGGHDARNFRVHGEAETLPAPMSKFMLQIGNYSTDPALKQDQYAYYPIKPVIIKAGETWTYSYYYASAGSAGGQASDYLMADINSPIWGLSMGHDLRETSGGQTTWHRFVKTWKADKDVTVAVLRFGFVRTSANVGGWICIDNIKLEKNPTATPWSPAPEDVM